MRAISPSLTLRVTPSLLTPHKLRAFTTSQFSGVVAKTQTLLLDNGTELFRDPTETISTHLSAAWHVQIAVFREAPRVNKNSLLAFLDGYSFLISSNSLMLVISFMVFGNPSFNILKFHPTSLQGVLFARANRWAINHHIFKAQDSSLYDGSFYCLYVRSHNHVLKSAVSFRLRVMLRNPRSVDPGPQESQLLTPTLELLLRIQILEENPHSPRFPLISLHNTRLHLLRKLSRKTSRHRHQLIHHIQNHQKTSRLAKVDRVPKKLDSRYPPTATGYSSSKGRLPQRASPASEPESAAWPPRLAGGSPEPSRAFLQPTSSPPPTLSPNPCCPFS